jgi:hypothetical protein
METGRGYSRCGATIVRGLMREVIIVEVKEREEIGTGEKKGGHE